MSTSLAHRHRHQMLLQQDDTDEVQLIVSDFSQDAPAKTQDPKVLPQVTFKASQPKKLSNEDLVHTEDLEYDQTDSNTYSKDELEAFTDSTISGKKNRDLFYYGMRPDPKPVVKPKTHHKEAPTAPANATKE